MAASSRAEPVALLKSDVAGDYQLRGVTDTASTLRLSPDGSYQFRLSAGPVHETDEGTWRIEDADVVLSTNAPDVSPHFIFERSSRESRSGVRVSFSGADARRVATSTEVALVAGGKPFFANQVGDDYRESSRATPPIDKVTLTFSSVLRSYAKNEYQVADPSHNHFVFKAVLGNYGLARFKDTRLSARNGDLTMYAAKLKRELKYVRVSSQ